MCVCVWRKKGRGGGGLLATIPSVLLEPARKVKFDCKLDGTFFFAKL